MCSKPLQTFLLFQCLSFSLYSIYHLYHSHEDSRAAAMVLNMVGIRVTPVVTFNSFIVQTSNLQFWKWQAKFQNMVGTSPHVPIRSGGPA